VATEQDSGGSDVGWQPSYVRLPPTPVSAAPFAPPQFTTDAGGPPEAPDGAPTAFVVPGEPAEPARRGKGKIIGGTIAVLALLGGGGFAVSRIVAGDESGAGSPKEVGTKFMHALGQEDVLGMVDLLLPGERTTFRQPLIDIVDNLKRLEVVDETASLDKVGGIDFSIDNLEVVDQPTNVDDVTNIELTGTGTASVDGEKVPIGRLLINEAFGGERPNLDAEPSSEPFDWHLTTVKQGDRWYLSLFYSLAEDARPDDTDIPAHGVTARGADTPEGAVQAMLDGVSDLDLEAIIAALNPNEAEALQRYAPIFIDEGQHAFDSAGVRVSFSDVKYTVTGSGDRRTVAIDALKVHATVQDSDFTMDVSNGCTKVTAEGETVDSCAGGNSVDEMLKTLGLSDNKDIQDFVKTVQDAFADIQPVGITVQQVEGKWYLSPIGTSVDAMLAVMAALDKNELTAIIDGVKKIVASGVLLQLDDQSASGSDSGSGGFQACYSAPAYPVFSQCVAQGMADGSIEPSFVPPYFRFPECGAGEPYFDGSISSMSDEEFVAFAQDKAPCFQKYVEDGTIFAFELPYELSKPDCLEGKNWYNSADQAYLDRVYACAT
jgi:hypothetical protein